MEKLKKIGKMIKMAQLGWSEIEGEIMREPALLCKSSVSLKMDKLKNLLEDIRANIESSLTTENLPKCKNFLETIFKISENLRVSYVFPGYVESYYIMDTLKIAGYSGER